MLGLVETPAVGVEKSAYDTMIRETESKLGVRNSPTMTRSSLKSIVKEEYKKILEDAKEAAPKIEKKLEECRSKMMCEFVTRDKVGTTFEAAMEKRLQLNTVSEMIDVPVNELMLYFVNNVKTSNDRKLVEYRLGHVYFYAS